MPNKAPNEALIDLQQQLRVLDLRLGLLAWRQETEEADVGEAQAACETQRQALLSAPQLGDWIAATDTASAAEQRALRRLARQRTLAMALPPTLVDAYARAQSAALDAWSEARAARDFSGLAAPFAELVRLAAERARALQHGLGTPTPYDALLDEHDPGQRRGHVDALLAAVATLPLVEAAAPEPALALEVDAQRTLAAELLAYVGFDLRRGALGEAPHPFTVVCGDADVRIALRYDPARLSSALLVALHEGGHGLFDQRLLAAHPGSVLAECPSAALHEAHARLFENVLGRSAAFWRGCPLPLPFDRERLLAELQAPRPHVRRLSADALSYHRHIALRCELEAWLLDGTLHARDLPAAWREASTRHLGLAPADDAEGCLQDNHWYSGMFGYFASYTTGELAAFQLAEAMQPQAALAAGDAAFVGRWLARHLPTDAETLREAVARATGHELSAAAFVRAAKERA